MRLALYQPDIPQNTGTLIRLSACMDIPMDIIEPCGFAFGNKEMRRAVMDYGPGAQLTRHASWDAFKSQAQGRLILLTTQGDLPYTQCRFAPDDILLLGRESAGVPDAVHEAADQRVKIPMAGQAHSHARSLNVAIAGAMVIGEALRQLADEDR